MWKLLLKKLGMSFLVAVVCFVGMFCYGLVLYPINLPYLLKMPAETDYVFAMIFALIFVSVATIRVRTKWCFEEDLFFAVEEDAPPLMRRVVTSQEYLADVIVFAVWVLIYTGVVGGTSGAPWYRVVLGSAILLVSSVLAFAVLDCLLYVIARKKADKQLRKRKEND